MFQHPAIVDVLPGAAGLLGPEGRGGQGGVQIPGFPRRLPSGADGPEGEPGSVGDRAVGAEVRGNGSLTVRWGILAQLADNAQTRGPIRSNTLFGFAVPFDGVDPSNTDYQRNPRFADPENGDFTLAPDSNEIDQANGSDVRVDRLANPRGILRDRGAFERPE